MSKTAITSPELAPPVGPFSQAVEVGGFLYFSGQVGQDPATGKVVEGGIVAETERVFQNLSAVLRLALKSVGHESNNWLVLGPWSAFQENGLGGNLGVFKWPEDTAKQFRHSMVMPFFNQYLRNGPPANLARATIYSPAEKRWQRF